MSEKDEASRWGRGQNGRNRRAEKLEKMRKKEELRLKYLENRTPFKTGWEIEETEEEKERKRLGLKEVRLVHVPKMDPYTDEQIAKMTDYERKEFEWKKTQRRVTEDYYHIAKDEIMRHCKPQRKLRPVGSCSSQEYRGPIVSLEAPVPYFSTDAIKDSGVRKELDLMCLEDRLYMEALICDIKGIENRHSFTLGPSASKWAKDYCLMRKNPNSTDRYPDKNVKCDRASTTTDPFGRAQVYYPDGYNYKGEEEAFRNRIQQATTNAIASRFLHLRDTTSNFMCSLTAGLQPTINLRDDENSFSRIFCIPTMDLSNLIFGLKGFVTFLGVREITAREKAYAAWKSDELGIAKSLLATEDTAYEVVFGSSQDGLNLCQKFGGRPDLFKAMMKYPIGLDDCTVPTKPAFHSLVLKWYPYASEQKIDIFLKNAEDVGYAEQVFSGHGIPAYIPDHWKYLKGNTRMEAGYQNSYSNMSYDSVVAERVIKEVLGANQIEVDRVLLRRRNIRPHTDGHITNLIHQRIGRAAINAHVWRHPYVPGIDAEWFKFTNENKYHLGWQLELPPDQAPGTNDYERKAIVTFDHDDFGLTVSTYLDERAPDKDIFSLAARDAQGVRFYPIYTTKFECPRPVRAVCDAALNAIDNEAREQSDYSKRTWVRLRDYKREDVLVVEGWPKEYIAETVEKVRAVLRGRVVACQDDGMERLLYGCGLQHVNQLQKTHDMVFLAVDRLNQEITMWGDEDAMDLVCIELDSYVKNRGAYMVNASIIIDTPRFLPIFSEILVFNTNERIGEAVGGAIARFRHPNRLEFMGSVIQYEDLQQLLDDTHAKILNVVNSMANCDDVSEFFQPADCPVCLCPTVGTYILELCGHHYCLQCLAQKIRVAIRERELPIRCCQEECNEVIALGDILGLLLDENSLKYPQFWMERLQTILKSCSETAVLNRRDVRFCTRPGCSAIIRLKVKGKRPEFYDCPRCQMQMCAGCWNPPHDGRSCDVEAALRGSVDLSLQEWSSGRQNEVKHCPTDNCRAVIQKEQGCNHMQCKMCKIHFCWLCSFTAETDRAIYSHMGERHGGTGGEWAFLDQQQANQALGAPPGLQHMAMVNDQGGGVVMIDGEPVWVD